MNPDDPAGAAVLEAARRSRPADPARAATPAAGVPDRRSPSPGSSSASPTPATATARRLLAAFVDHWYARHVRPAVAMLRAPPASSGSSAARSTRPGPRWRALCSTATAARAS